MKHLTCIPVHGILCDREQSVYEKHLRTSETEMQASKDYYIMPRNQRQTYMWITMAREKSK